MPAILSEPPPCPLCATPQGTIFFEGTSGAFRNHPRTYFRCGTCDLIFTSVSQRLSPQDEKAEYDRHQNSPDDQGYRRFLSRLFEPVQARLGDHSRGLDFGSGPGPTLSVMLEEAGHSVALYDPFYAPDATVLQQTYDFVTATEVVEHLHHPRQDLEQLWRCLKPGGWLGIMTKLAHPGDKRGDENSALQISDTHRATFATWHYKDDLTHVCFFSRRTFLWLSRLWQCPITFLGNDVILLQKPIEACKAVSSLSHGNTHNWHKDSAWCETANDETEKESENEKNLSPKRQTATESGAILG